MAGYIGNKSSVTLVDGITKNGGTLEGDLSFGDNDKAIFGAGDDLQIYHSGSHSVIKDAGDGNLQLIANDFQLRNGADNANMMTGANGGAITLMHNGSSKLATTSTGIGVTGNLTLPTDTAYTSANSIRNDSNALIFSGGTSGYYFNRHNNSATDLSIDSSGKVGIGTDSPSYKLDVAGHIQIRAGESLRLQNVAGSSAATISCDGAGTNSDLSFKTANSERMRIHQEGDVLIGQTTQTNGHGKIQLSGRNGHHCATFKNGNNGGYGLVFRNTSASSVGSVTWTASSTSYNTSSDYRLKENVVDLTGASARVNQLNPSRFNFIADDTNTLVDGFLAHEVATVVPEAINGTKDAMKDEEYEVTPAVLDDDGNVTTEAVMGTRSVPDYQGIDQSKLVPLLTAALQEALTEIASLKTRVEALEA